MKNEFSTIFTTAKRDIPTRDIELLRMLFNVITENKNSAFSWFSKNLKQSQIIEITQWTLPHLQLGIVLGRINVNVFQNMPSPGKKRYILSCSWIVSINCGIIENCGYKVGYLDIHWILRPSSKWWILKRNQNNHTLTILNIFTLEFLVSKWYDNTLKS